MQRPPPPPVRAHSPGFRNLVHFAVFFLVGLPLLGIARANDDWLHWITGIKYWIAGFLSLVTLFNAFILRRIPILNLTVREQEHWYSGLWLYPCSIAVCFVLFPMYAAFGAWAALACGDASASFFGRWIPHYKLPWNPKKTYAGLVSFIAFATFGLYISLFLMPCDLFVKDGWPEMTYVWTLAAVAALSSAIAESIDTQLDDNVRIAFSSALTILGTAYFLKYSTQYLPEDTHVKPQNLVYALIANAVLGASILLLGFADFPATALGMALGTLIFFYAGWQGYVLFFVFVALGSLASKVGLAKKKAAKIEEANEGKRGVSNVAANLLVPAMCCAAYPLLAGRPSLLMGFAGAIAAALADTASSEIGVLSRKEPLLLTTFKPVPHGTNGAVSLLGTAAALAASLLVALAACANGFVKIARGGVEPVAWPVLIGAGVVIALAGMCGTFVDSLLGATVEGKVKFIGKGAVNFCCALAGALLAGLATEAWLYLAGK